MNSSVNSPIPLIVLMFLCSIVLPRPALGQEDSAIPLTHIDVTGHISGDLAEITVEQTYENHLEERIEAVYVFPLPHDAAVNEMIMVIGERRIRADLQEREQAREAYETARDSGQTASLLEQERPNIFTMNVANIEPGQPIRVLVRYVEQLTYEDGRYNFHHPTVVGPRFIPGNPTGQDGTGMLPDTDVVPDASRITPAILPEGTATPYDVTFSVNLQAGMEIRDLDSTSHDLELEWATTSDVTISLPEDQRQPDRDIVFTYALAGDEPEVGLLTHFDEGGGFFTLMLQPPVDFDPEAIRPREMVFVLDCSGSMSGTPMDISKGLMRHALQNMNPSDTFQIIRFSEASSALSETPLLNTPENVELGLEYIDSLSGTGGTMMTEGIRAALMPSPDEDRMRIVLFMTDGYIGNERDVTNLIEELLGESRLFSLGVGSSVNRYLLDAMARTGRGEVHYVGSDETNREVIETFYGRINNPILTDIAVDWGSLNVSDIIPERIPDVFAGVPIVITGRFEEAGADTVTVSGLVGIESAEYQIDLSLTEDSEPRPAISALWARRKIESLEFDRNLDEEQRRLQVIDLALEFRLMTQYTSFVAIEEEITADAQDPLRTIGVPVALPDGVSASLLGPQVMGQGGESRFEDSDDECEREEEVEEEYFGEAVVSLEIVSASGGLSEEDITQTLEDELASFRRCYQRFLDRDDNITGTFVIRVTIGLTGEVSEVTTVEVSDEETSLDNAIIETCAMRHVQGMSFGEAEATTVVEVRFESSVEW